MSRRRQSLTAAVGFGLAFLDVLSCGLGAATLLLLILKHGPGEEADVDHVSTRVAEVQAEYDSLARSKDDLLSELKASDQQIERQIAAKSQASQTASERSGAVTRLQTQLLSARQELAASRSRLRDARQQRSLAAPQPSGPRTANRGALIGIEVKPERVAILLDRSASMLAATLVDIIRARASTDAVKRASAKWTTAREAAQWAYGQLPNGSSFQILTYAETVQDLAGNSYEPGAAISWLRKNPATDARTLLRRLRDTVPSGATNLKAALQAASGLSPRPSQILLISDGYPTLPGDSRLRSLKGCPRPVAGVTAFLSAECRFSVFRDAVKSVEKKLGGTQFDVVMLPLEGDADAIQGYWGLAARQGGRLLTPAPGWPHL